MSDPSDEKMNKNFELGFLQTVGLIVGCVTLAGITSLTPSINRIIPSALFGACFSVFAYKILGTNSANEQDSLTANFKIPGLGDGTAKLFGTFLGQ